MAKLKKESAEIVSIIQIANGIYSMWLHNTAIVQNAKPGQFISLYCREGSRLLPRPISICEIQPENGLLRLVFRIAGAGTEEFSKAKAGESIEVLGPLGNGFPEKEMGHAILVGGGIGIPPMLALVKQLFYTGCNCIVVLGYKEGTAFLKEEFEPYARVLVSTEDGSQGIKGNVIDALRKEPFVKGDIFACGPTPMLRGIKAFAAEKDLQAWLSLEERMACGIGACLACVCQSKEQDSHSHVCNKRVCKDGPVFLAESIEL